jgi:hypothetical protein
MEAVYDAAGFGRLNGVVLWRSGLVFGSSSAEALNVQRIALTDGRSMQRDAFPKKFGKDLCERSRLSKLFVRESGAIQHNSLITLGIGFVRAFDFLIHADQSYALHIAQNSFRTPTRIERPMGSR